VVAEDAGSSALSASSGRKRTKRERQPPRDNKPRVLVPRDRGYWGIGLYLPKKEHNVGTLLRNAYAFGASFIYTIGARCGLQASDTSRAWRHVPVFQYRDLDDFVTHLPHACPLVGVEILREVTPLPQFAHPERCCYLLGAEESRLPHEVAARCQHVVRVPGAAVCLNVASAATIVMYDGVSKRLTLRNHA
jgi:tRNA G18 (ribose-2'-O)-methylase SpoU